MGRYYATGGKDVVITRDPAASDGDMRVFLLGSVMGAVLHQRGILALHASAVAVNGHTACFLGASGAGKSTLAAALTKRGYPVLADDLCAVTLDADGVPIVHPGSRQIKLWADAMKKLGQSKVGLRRVRKNLEKYGFLPPPERCCREPLPLGHIFIMSTVNTLEHRVERLSGMKKQDLLTRYTCRSRFIEGLGTKADHFRVSSHTAKHAEVYRVQRPYAPFLLDELSDRVEREFSS